MGGHNSGSIERAIALLKGAVALDPACGRAHAFLAWCYAQNVGYVWTEGPERDLDRALNAVAATAGLIDDDPTALMAAGGALSHCGDQERAFAYLERALELDSKNA